MSKPPCRPHPSARQSGVMTLLFSLLLLVGAGILAFSAGRTSVVEQRIANNEHQSIEAQQTAQAGLDYALAWLTRNTWTEHDALPTSPKIRAPSGQAYDLSLEFAEVGDTLCARSTSRAIGSDTELTTLVQECFTQTGLFATSPDARMPPPLVLSGCMKSAPQTSEMLLSQDAPIAALSGREASATCLPLGSVDVSIWSDNDDDRVFDPIEEGASAPYSRAYFAGCTDDHCAWNQTFALSFEDAVTLAKGAGHVYSDKIPCGASAPPGIYLIEHEEAIDTLDITATCAGENGVDSRTIGTPDKPILLIVPATDDTCPSFSRDISIYGIVYFESTSACTTPSWDGATIHGAVIWEGDALAPGEHSKFIATDHGRGSALNAAFQVVTGAARVPGTWRDWREPEEKSK